MATIIIKAKSTNIVEDITNQILYGPGYSNSDITFIAKRIGKIVIVGFVCQRRNLLPSESWGSAYLLNGLPYISVDDGEHYRVDGVTVNSKIPFCFSVSQGTLRLHKLQAGTETDDMPNYFGGEIVYFAN